MLCRAKIMRMHLNDRVTDEEKWKEISIQWNELLQESHFNDIFLTYEWMSVAWSIFKDGELCIVLLEDREKIVCILPLYKYKLGPFRILKFIGTGLSDYGSFIIHKDYDIKETIHQAFDILLKEKDWDAIDLQQIPDDSPIYKGLKGFLTEPEIKNKQYVSLKEMVNCPFVCFEDKGNTFEAEVNKTLLRKIRGREKQVLAEKTSLILEDEFNHQLIDEVLGAFFTMHIKRWKAAGRKSIFTCKKCRSFYREMAVQLSKNDWFYMPTLKIENEYAAFEYAFRYNKKIYDYTSAYEIGFEGYFPGLILKKHLIFFNSDKDLREIDFLRGDEQYKYKWTKHYRVNYRFLLFKKSARGQICHLFWKIKRRLRQIDIFRKLNLLYLKIKNKTTG